MDVTLPYDPRPWQRAAAKALQLVRFGVLVCHRRAGKTVFAVVWLIIRALTCSRSRPRCAYIAPTYRMGKATAWDYLKHFSRAIPGIAINESELRIDYPNGGQVRVYGADNPDSLRGIYLDAAVLDEYGLMAADVFSTVIRPALADRIGSALLMGTPNGQNQFYDAAEHAKPDSDWWFGQFKASETGILSADELAAARSVMTPDEYDQEFECSFTASVKGAIYAREVAAVDHTGQLTRVPVDPILPIDTAWDLGVGDACAIWFSQSLRSGEVRIVDFYEASGEGLPHYASVLRGKGYAYGRHVAPHDIQVRELASGRSRLEVAASLGIRFDVAPQVPVEDGIHAVRLLLPRCWFDAERCRPGLDALRAYRRDYNRRLDEFKATPVHDWASHAADAFRYLAVSQHTPKATHLRDPEPREYPREHGWLA